MPLDVSPRFPCTLNRSSHLNARFSLLHAATAGGKEASAGLALILSDAGRCCGPRSVVSGEHLRLDSG